MATVVWGAWAGDLRLGIEISTGTQTDTTIYYEVRYYVETRYSISDNMTLTVGGSQTVSNIDFNFSRSSGGVMHVFTRGFNSPKVYGGGPTYTFTGSISGYYQGYSPSASRSYTIPARPPSPPDQIATPTITNLTGTSARINWNIPGTNGSPITSYRVQLSTTSNFSSGVTTYTDYSPDLNVSGLSPGTNYWTRVAANSDAGLGPYSSARNFKTHDVPNKVGLPSVGSITGDSATVSWSAPGTNGLPITGYQIQRSTSSTFSSGVATYTTSSTSYGLTGLSKGTAYYTRVRANSSAGYGAWSSTRSFTTDNVPNRVGTPSLTTPTPTTIGASWSAPSNNGASIIEYQIQVATDSGFSNIVEDDTTASTSYTTGELAQGQAHSVRVRARNAEGWGDWSPANSISTYYQDLSTYPTPTPVISMASGNTSHRAIARIDIVEGHPFTNGTRTITYEYSKASDFSSIELSGTVNFDSRTIYGGQTGESVNFSNDFQMAIAVSLPSQGTWYIRAKTGGSDNLAESDYDSGSFTSTHVPSVSVSSPAQSAKILYASVQNFQFTITDPSPGEVMSAYQIVVERNADASVVWDSGKVVASLPKGSNSIAHTISASEKDVALRWRVRVWDSTDTVSNWTGYSVFTLVDRPVVTITNPAHESSITTGAPTFTWTVGLTSDRVQSSAVVTVTVTDTGDPVWTRTVTGTSKSITPSTTILSNGVNYTVTVEVTDSANITGSSSHTFETSYVAPSPIQYDVTVKINEQGFIEINWTSTPPDTRLVAWRIYRRAFPSDVWELIVEIHDEVIRTYRDYLVKSGVTYQYNVTQLADRSGELLESPLGMMITDEDAVEAESRFFEVIIDQYWIIVPDRPELTMLLPNVTTAPEVLEFEDATYTIIGRGRHRDYGDELGYSGSITLQVRQPEISSSVRANLEALRRARETYWLRTPFGRLIQVALGDISWEPIAGTGLMEMGDLSFTYEEVN